MLSSRWHKVLNDLLSNKTRTVLIVLSIAVGLFAVGTIISSQSHVTRISYALFGEWRRLPRWTAGEP